jgi:Zn-dependent M28 family amino/carboxypeptidase
MNPNVEVYRRRSGRCARTAVGFAASLLLTSPANAGAQVALDARQLFEDLSALSHDSLQGRAPGTDGSRMAREYVVSRLEALGLGPVADTFALDGPGGAAPGINVHATVRGMEFPDRYLVLSAHYDHMGVRDGRIYNGADDNASGVSVLLQLAAFLTRVPPRHSVTLVFLDAEEVGLRGARHFVAHPPMPLEQVVMNVNLDMVARTEGELWAVGTALYPALRPVVEAVTPVPPVFLRYGHDTETDRGSGNWVGASDHAAFHRVGIPFLYFGVSDHPDYHQPEDDAEAVDPEVFAAVAETLRRVLVELDGALSGRRPID